MVSFLDLLHQLTRYNIASRILVEEINASIVNLFSGNVCIICMQFEGETNKSGKGPNIWDTFIEEHPGISLFNAGVRYNAFLTKTTKTRSLLGEYKSLKESPASMLLNIDIYDCNFRGIGEKVRANIKNVNMTFIN